MDWTKPNGSEITTNDLPATVEYCLSLGWERKDAVQQVEEEASEQAEAQAEEVLEKPKKRGRPRKTEA